MNLVTSSFELFGIFVFVEIIELNFFGLDRNLRKYIDNRAEDEINNIFEISDEQDSSDTESNKKENNEDDTSVIP